MALFARYGRVFSPEHKRRLLGTAGQVAGGVLAEALDQPGREEALARELVEAAWPEVASGAAPRPGATGLVTELRGRVPIAVASNSPRGMLDAALGASGFAQAFDFVIGGDEVANPKPAPDIYLTACAGIGVEPSRSVALEDSPTGVAAARAAGLHVIGVPSMPGVTLPAHELAESLEDQSVREALGLDGARPSAASA